MFFSLLYNLFHLIALCCSPFHCCHQRRLHSLPQDQDKLNRQDGSLPPESRTRTTLTTTQGQKVNCNPQKLISIVSYLQRTRTAHTIKDLEKNLPSVASINGMQVKGLSSNVHVLRITC